MDIVISFFCFFASLAILSGSFFDGVKLFFGYIVAVIAFMFLTGGDHDTMELLLFPAEFGIFILIGTIIVKIKNRA